MESILLLFSLILHGITFVVIFLLYQKIKQASEGERNFEQRVQEIEDLFSSYLLEIKDENKAFVEKVSEIDQNPKVHKTLQFQGDSATENQDTVQLSQNYTKPHKQSLFQPELVKVKDHVEQPSLHSKIMHLYENGYTTEDIAKKLNKGKTEVELIVKFNQKMHH
ncbi:DUF6115 domain-containing protein [Tenuibacillus multivorans]|uniref:Swarming motility protein SwrB n=1 Tax=Tenuibacillus multivorans TaxID=237069 RepID=A0A1G9XYA5_9BACI|nr:hypothetical protein [Tenuibacillus multivorans]GEL75850.1 swarming motility protein SwrB [Tenuibacillus multivorans]SDN01253.1 hypothetical protein SAMN05216498_1143 [Tenuibacillus multivorans]